MIPLTNYDFCTTLQCGAQQLWLLIHNPMHLFDVISIYIYTTINQTSLAKDWRPSSPHYCPKHMNKVVKRIRSHPQFTMASMGRIEIHGFSSI